MPNDDDSLERRQARKGTYQISGTAFGLLATLLVMAIGGLVKSLWDQHSAATRFESQIAHVVERIGHEAGNSKSDRERNEFRIKSLETSTREHERMAERLIGQWGYQLRDFERRISILERKCEVINGLAPTLKQRDFNE